MRSISSYFCSKSNKDDVKPSCTQEADTQLDALLRVSGMFGPAGVMLTLTLTRTRTLNVKP